MFRGCAGEHAGLRAPGKRAWGALDEPGWASGQV
jgi:hypothetical protein